MMFSKLTDYELALLGRETYDKRHWSDEDVRMLRECWDEYQRRGADTMTFCRPSYSDVLTFHQIDDGDVGEDDVRLLERAGAGIAPDYREVMRKLRAVERIEEPSQRDTAFERRRWSGMLGTATSAPLNVTDRHSTTLRVHVLERKSEDCWSEVLCFQSAVPWLSLKTGARVPVWRIFVK